MADDIVIVAAKRAQSGTRVARRLRGEGRLPGVVYGHQKESVPVSFSAEDFHAALRHGARIIDLQTDGAKQKTLVKEIQWDVFGQEILHVDFARVTADEKVTVEVALELRGTSPGAEAGGVLDQQLHAVTVECAVQNVPETIQVNINELQLEEVIHVQDLELPAGVVAKDDPDAVVVQVVPPMEVPEEEEAEVGEQAEPELIKREKEEEEEEGE